MESASHGHRRPSGNVLSLPGPEWRNDLLKVAPQIGYKVRTKVSFSCLVTCCYRKTILFSACLSLQRSLKPSPPWSLLKNLSGDREGIIHIKKQELRDSGESHTWAPTLAQPRRGCVSWESCLTSLKLSCERANDGDELRRLLGGLDVIRHPRL